MEKWRERESLLLNTAAAATTSTAAAAAVSLRGRQLHFLRPEKLSGRVFAERKCK